MPTSDTKRPICRACLRPQSACICRWIAPVDNTVEVLILQHPLETGQAKNSARLLHLSLANSRLEIGESFAENALQAMLHKPSTRQPVLLYPAEAEADNSTRATTVPERADGPTEIRLVVLDGTWRKTRKMLHLNPLLRRLPRLPLKKPPQSRYLIRKAHRPEQLSTLEATCHALMQLENAAARYESLLHAFDRFVAMQQAYAMNLSMHPASHRQ